MKIRNPIRSFAWVVTAILVTVTQSLAAEDPAETLAQRLKQLYPNTQFSAVSESALPGLFEVVMGRNIAYTDVAGRYFLFGHLFDMPAQRDLTAERKDQLQRIDFGQLPLQDAIKTVRGNGSRILAVFSDPDCPYCRRLEPELAKVNDVTVYTFLMPLTQLHPEARAKAIAVWCAADRVDAWAKLMLGGETPANTDCAHPVDRNIALGERLQINGTPTMIAADGRIMPGAAGAAQIEAWLAMGRSPIPARGSRRGALHLDRRGLRQFGSEQSAQPTGGETLNGSRTSADSDQTYGSHCRLSRRKQPDPLARPHPAGVDCAVGGCRWRPAGPILRLCRRRFGPLADRTSARRRPQRVHADHGTQSCSAAAFRCEERF